MSSILEEIETQIAGLKTTEGLAEIIGAAFERMEG